MKKIGYLVGMMRSNFRRRRRSVCGSSGDVKSRSGGGELGEDLTELAKVDETGIGIILEITLRQSTKARQLRRIYREKIKIG